MMNWCDGNGITNNLQALTVPFAIVACPIEKMYWNCDQKSYFSFINQHLQSIRKSVGRENPFD